MIEYEELRFGNIFSYGPKNVLKLNEAALTQILGKNGHGKSSIALILEEVQFNTNSKKIKKADIINRYTKDKSYFIELDFNKNGKRYTIATNRTATTSTVKFSCDGVDISSHTPTGTYKTIEAVLGYDHKTFSQVVYQSSVTSLEFLTATDTARKTFLIQLLNLEEYSKNSEVFKKLAAEISKKLDACETRSNTITSFIQKYAKEDLTLGTLMPMLPELVDEPQQLHKLHLDLKNIDSHNAKVTTNNTYKKVLDNIELSPWSGDIPDSQKYLDNKVALGVLQKEQLQAKGVVSKGSCKVTKCPTCKQDVDNATAFEMAQVAQARVTAIYSETDILVDEINQYEKLNKEYQASMSKTAEWEKYFALVDKTLTSELLDKDTITSEIARIEKVILEHKKADSIIKAHNKSTEERNLKVAIISKQLEEMKAELSEESLEQAKLSKELSNLQVLVKAFSNTGLVAYKIECLVKDLEDIANTYLAEMAGGRFQLSFRIASADKLNVVITDNGRDISIEALSSGERARVNVSTLLAIRSLMQSLSNSRTNLLILDETVESLDAEGKEKLIEVLLGEGNLNTFLVSHGFSHPLLEKLQVVKENNVSRIE